MYVLAKIKQSRLEHARTIEAVLHFHVELISLQVLGDNEAEGIALPFIHAAANACAVRWKIVFYFFVPILSCLVNIILILIGFFVIIFVSITIIAILLFDLMLEDEVVPGGKAVMNILESLRMIGREVHVGVRCPS